VGSEPLGKFSTLFDFSTVCQKDWLYRHDPICRVLSVELLQFYYSTFTAGPSEAEENKSLPKRLRPPVLRITRCFQTDMKLL